MMPASEHIAANTPLIVVAGKEYGTGSSRDWAAKGTTLLGVKAVIAESFERIHRSNLVGMGVLPLQFKDGMTRESLKLIGDETFDVAGIASGLKPRMDIAVTITRAGGKKEEIKCLCRIDTLDEMEYLRERGNPALRPALPDRKTNKKGGFKTYEKDSDGCFIFRRLAERVSCHGHRNHDRRAAGGSRLRLGRVDAFAPHGWNTNLPM